MATEKVLGKKVLLAEDESQVREAIRLLLVLDEHAVTEARDGRDALEKFAPGRFDLVITDYVMPRMLGDELATQIKQIAPHQPVLMISAYASDLACTSADALLSKPFSFVDLRQAMARLLSAPTDSPKD